MDFVNKLVYSILDNMFHSWHSNFDFDEPHEHPFSFILLILFVSMSSAIMKNHAPLTTYLQLSKNVAFLSKIIEILLKIMKKRKIDKACHWKPGNSWVSNEQRIWKLLGKKAQQHKNYKIWENFLDCGNSTLEAKYLECLLW